MNQKLKSLLSTLLYAGIYFVMQLIISIKIYSVVLIMELLINADKLTGEFEQTFNFLFEKINVLVIPILIISAIAAIAFSYGIFSIRNKKPIKAIKGKKFSLKYSIYGLIMVLPIIGLSNLIVDVLLYFSPQSYEKYADIIVNMMENTSVVWLLLGVGIIAPIAEELIFRGFIQKRLLDSFPVWAAIVIQAFFFALIHGNLVQMSYAFVIGIILGLLVYKSNSIYPAIILHVVNNSIAVFSDVAMDNVLYFILPVIAVIMTVILAFTKKEMLFTKEI